MANIRTEIKKLYNLPVYQELNEYYQKDNIFLALNKARNENTHSAFLAWLLNPQSGHGLKDYALRKLLRLYSTHEAAQLDELWLNTLLVGNYTLDEVEVDTEKPIKNGRMDIFVKASITPKSKDTNDDENGRNLLLCIENKIYSKEHDEQTTLYHKYLTSIEKDSNSDISPLLIEIFLAPDGEYEISANSFVHITYGELLADVIEPLLNVNYITNYAATYIEDYIRVLGRPFLGDYKENIKQNYTLLAISKTEKEKLHKIFNEEIYKIAYLAVNKSQQDVNSFTDKWQINPDDVEKDMGLLSDLWNNNIAMFEAVALNEKLPLDAVRGESNRDVTKYIIKYDGQILNFKKKNGQIRYASKGECALLIFKAWCKWQKDCNGKKPSLADIRKAFPIKLNSYYSGQRNFETLFCPLEDDGKVYWSGQNPKFELFYYANKHVANDNNPWDFFNADDEHTLCMSDYKCLSLKMWRKPDFENLLKRVKDLGYFDSKLSIDPMP